MDKKSDYTLFIIDEISEVRPLPLNEFPEGIDIGALQASAAHAVSIIMGVPPQFFDAWEEVRQAVDDMGERMIDAFADGLGAGLTRDLGAIDLLSALEAIKPVSTELEYDPDGATKMWKHSNHKKRPYKFVKYNQCHKHHKPRIVRRSKR